MSEDSELAKSGNVFNKDDEDTKKIEKLIKESDVEGQPDDSLRVELESPIVKEFIPPEYFLDPDRFYLYYFVFFIHNII